MIAPIRDLIERPSPSRDTLDEEAIATRSGLVRTPMPDRVAAIDVGSNSVRVAVVELGEDGQLEVIEEARDAPCLIRDVELHGGFTSASIDRVVAALRSFLAIADATGARPIAVATSATRDASNAGELIERVRDELGLEVRVIDGEEEARLAFLGAVHSLAADDGFVLDVGGGSLEVVRFEARRAAASWTLPLGAVRLTDRFLKSDRPSASELQAMRKFITTQIKGADLPTLGDGEMLVGTGGTIRTLAKIDRARRPYPLSRLHGYDIERDKLRRIVDMLQSRTLAARRSVSGLNEDRAETIVAGAHAVQAVVNALHASAVVVSGQGLREGVAIDAGSGVLPSADGLRRAALRAITAKFAPRLDRLVEQRVAELEALIDATAFVPPIEIAAALEAAARVLDIGRTVDYYRRYRHTETLLLEHGLPGWSHRELALICAIVRQAEREKYDATTYRPLTSSVDMEPIARAAALLAVADEIARRRPPESDPIVWHIEDDQVVTADECLLDWPGDELRPRFKRVFGLELCFDEGARD